MNNWDDLKYILAIKRAGGLSGAARLLGVNHATISRHLSAAENKLGVRLFDRLPSGLVPTKHGQHAITTAEQVEQQLLQLDVSLAAKDTSLAGPLRITAPQLLIQHQLADILANYANANPAVELTILAANEILNLHRREADIAIRISDKPEPSLFGRVLTGQMRGYYASKAYFSSHSESLQQHQSEDPIDYISFLWWGENPPKDLKARYPNARTSVRMDDMIAVISAIHADMGIARLPCFLGDSAPDLVRIPTLPVTPYFDIWILTHPDLKDVARIRHFMQFAAKALTANSDLYMGKSISA